jgi:nitric oxide reductase NorD protein
MTLIPLSAIEIEALLDDYLEADLNRLVIDKQVLEIAQLSRYQQDRALHWVKIAANAHTEIGFTVCISIAKALQLMDESMLSQWIVYAMEKLDVEGLIPAVQSLLDVEKFAAEAKDRARGVVFEEVSGMLSLFVQGLSGRSLKLERAETAWTDTETIYLPEYVGNFDEHDDNFALYKSILAHQWAQLWFGTWQVELLADHKAPRLCLLNQLEAHILEIPHALDYLHRLETIRLDYRIAEELPGIHRNMQHVLQLLDQVLIPTDWQEDIAPLLSKEASINTSCQLLIQVLKKSSPSPLCFQGQWQIENLQSTLASRMLREKKELQKAIWKLSEEQKKKKLKGKAESEEKEDSQKSKKLEVKKSEETQLPNNFDMEITLDDEPIQLNIEATDTFSSILQDFSEIPEEYLQTGFAGAYDTEADKKSVHDDLWSGTYHEEGALYYNEWDYKRLHYRKDWCVLRELELKPQGTGFVKQTLLKHEKLVKQLHKSFEALRGEDKLLKRQVNGDDIDVDAVVEAWVDSHLGMEMTDRLYTQMQRVERSIAVMFMVDMSGSTQGWINDAERESLILLCEVLEILGDQYAIYGFSGWARKRCDIYKVKQFNEPYDENVQGKIAAIDAQDYTRMGVAIRHLSSLLNQVEAKTRILITLSDGRPEDYGEYRGKYGIEDTRMALLEAKQSGIHSFCITIDKQGLEYLPHMYGAANYAVIDEVEKLPLKVADIYRKLTT